MYPHHVFNLEPAGIFRMYPICYLWVSGRYLQPEPVMYSRCFHWFPGPLAPSDPVCPLGRAGDVSGQTHVVLEVVEIVTNQLGDDPVLFHHLLLQICYFTLGRAELLFLGLDPTKLLGLHDHRIVRAVHHVLSLKRKIDQ